MCVCTARMSLPVMLNLSLRLRSRSWVKFCGRLVTTSRKKARPRPSRLRHTCNELAKEKRAMQGLLRHRRRSLTS